MFEFLFKYPLSVFQKGEFALLGKWPVALLVTLIVITCAVTAGLIWRRRSDFASGLRGGRPAVIWLLQAAMLSLLLLLLWQPALQLFTLKPQQNVVAVVVDDSRSMAVEEDGRSRQAIAVDALSNGVLESLQERFQVRLYRMGAQLERMKSLDGLTAALESTRISDSLSQVMAESDSLPVGAVLLVTDGADNSGGIDLETIADVRARKIPIHTVGIGRERFDRDIEIVDVETPDRALADSRLVARVSLRQTGYAGREIRLTAREDGKILASQQITLGDDGTQQIEVVMFNAGVAGAKHLHFSADVLEAEENVSNNVASRLINVLDARPRVLYLEGEPRWEYKFIRRALETDRSVNLVSILRTTQNKIYRQGIGEPDELVEGFPGAVEDLFQYRGLIIGSVEASYFTRAQQELIREFVDRRGGGVLFLGGRASLADGGYGASTLAELIPAQLPSQKSTFSRERVSVALTSAGRESLITRLVESADRNVERWSELPRVADYQELGQPKPGAIVLAELTSPIGRELPLLVTQKYGHGRTAVFATGGSWRWQMQQDLEDQTHEVFWQQLLRWLITGTPGPVNASTPRQVLSDDNRVLLRAVVKDRTYAPAPDARVEARILGPDGMAATVEMIPDPHEAGLYTAEWSADVPGSFIAEVIANRGEEEIGRDVLNFRREDGVAENFRLEQNRELLEKLSQETGGQYYTPETLAKLARDISYSEAGITVRETYQLWNIPLVFLLLITLKALEWYLRRRWGVV